MQKSRWSVSEDSENHTKIDGLSAYRSIIIIPLVDSHSWGPIFRPTPMPMGIDEYECTSYLYLDIHRYTCALIYVIYLFVDSHKFLTGLFWWDGLDMGNRIPGQKKMKLKRMATIHTKVNTIISAWFQPSSTLW